MADWVVTGAGGQLGSALAAQLSEAGIDHAAPGHAELDAADAGAVKAYLERHRPRTVVNAAGFTHVDRCETEAQAAVRGNVEAPAVLAGACGEIGAQLVHISTDYVFAGDASRPYREDDPIGPRSTYGRTKLEGERRVLVASADHLVVRTSWVFGRGRNFIAAILNQARLRKSGEVNGPLRVVDDQTGRPTYAVDLARGIQELLEARATGLFHLANEGTATWWDLARFCLDEGAYADLEIQRIRTEELNPPAPRPSWSVLDCSKAEGLGVRLRGWRDAVRAYLRSDFSPVAA